MDSASEKGEEVLLHQSTSAPNSGVQEEGFYESNPMLGVDSRASDNTEGNVNLDFINGFSDDSRFQQAFAVGNKVISSASKYNPLKDVSSLQQLSNKLRKEILACMDPRGYSKPASREEAISRMRSNLSYFRVSYGTTTLFFLIYFLLTSPILLFELMITVAMWLYFFKIKADQTVEIGSYKLGNREKLLLALPVTAFVALFGGLITYIIWVSVVSSAFVLVHAAFHKEIEVNPLDDLAESQQEFV